MVAEHYDTAKANFSILRKIAPDVGDRRGVDFHTQMTDA